MRALILAAVAAALALPAVAQTERLPLRSRSERQVDDINRSIGIQGRELRQDQQTQFEINQLRNQPVIGAPAYTIRGSRGCPPTSIGC
jgi:hypothetical protein